MIFSDFKDKKVALLGAGMENLRLLPHLIRASAEVTLCNQWESEVPELYIDKIQLRLGDEHLKNLDDFDYLFRSPGLPISRIDAALKDASHQPIRTSAMDLFFSMNPGITVGVTGTKGKGTTTMMIGTILKSAGKDVIIAGNIGAVVFDELDRITPETITVLELSSFQLEDITHSPDIAVLLPIVPDHLQSLSERSPNYHKTFEHYALAKANITAYQTPNSLLVYAADNLTTHGIADRSNARRLGVGEKSGDVIVSDNGLISANSDEQIDLGETSLRGRHIYLDAALAATVCRELGCSAADVISGLKAFEPLPHRLQEIGTVNGVMFIDDSYATAPDATIAAIEAFDQPIIWIGGGSRKGALFEELAQTIVDQKIKAVVLLGEESNRLAEALKQAKYVMPITIVDSMEAVVQKATNFAQSGDVVLLSPACASKDMFKNAADRGEQFTKLVLEGKNGVVL